jgi:hypothetical protein
MARTSTDSWRQLLLNSGPRDRHMHDRLGISWPIRTWRLTPPRLAGFWLCLCSVSRWDLSSCDERACVGAKHRSPLVPSQSRRRQDGSRQKNGGTSATAAAIFKKSRRPVHPWFTLVHSRFRRSVRGLPCQLLTTQPNVDATWGGGVRNVQQKTFPGNCHNREGRT